MTDFAAALAVARKRHGWTLQEIADRLGVQLCTVRSWLKDPETAKNARRAPEWAAPSLTALAYGRAVSVVRGAVRVTYAPATRGRS